jgi:hypothetical protein
MPAASTDRAGSGSTVRAIASLMRKLMAVVVVALIGCGGAIQHPSDPAPGTKAAPDVKACTSKGGKNCT